MKGYYHHQLIRCLMYALVVLVVHRDYSNFKVLLGPTKIPQILNSQLVAKSE